MRRSVTSVGTQMRHVNGKHHEVAFSKILARQIDISTQGVTFLNLHSTFSMIEKHHEKCCEGGDLSPCISSQFTRASEILDDHTAHWLMCVTQLSTHSFSF